MALVDLVVRVEMVVLEVAVAEGAVEAEWLTGRYHQSFQELAR